MKSMRCWALIVLAHVVRCKLDWARHGTIEEFQGDTPRYTLRCPLFKGADLSESRRKWFLPVRHKNKSYRWTAKHANACVGDAIEAPSPAAARAALRGQTVVFAGDSLALQNYLSMAALLVCDGDDGVEFQRPEGRLSTTFLPRDNVTVRYVQANFGVETERGAAAGEAWFKDHRGKKQQIKATGSTTVVRPWASPAIHRDLAHAIDDYANRSDVTYFVNFGHWVSSIRSDVQFFDAAGPLRDDRRIFAYEALLKATSTAIARRLAPTQRAVFSSYVPGRHDSADEACSEDGLRWGAAARRGVGKRLDHDGVYFLDASCPLARVPESAYADGDITHGHLPGAPDLASGLLARLLACYPGRPG